MIIKCSHEDMKFIMRKPLNWKLDPELLSVIVQD